LHETDVRLHQLFDRVARSRSDAIALVYEDRRISFFELQLYVEWMSGYFQSIRLQPGQRVALLLANSPKLVISLFGLWRAGGVAVPLEISPDESALRSKLALSRASVIVTTPEYKTLVDRVLAENGVTLAHLTVAIFEEDNIVTLNETRRGAAAPEKIVRVEDRGPANGRAQLDKMDAVADHLAVIQFEADLQYYRRSHEELSREAEAMTAHVQLTANDRMVCLAPLSQQSCLSNFLIAAIAAGATLVLAESSDWESLGRVCVDERVTVVAGPAALLIRLAKNNAAAISSVRRYFYTDAVLSPELRERLPKQAGLQIEPLSDAITTGILN
jgi:acyl-CoA synthetase (AMP-forming)/AMP-acid ligase II